MDGARSMSGESTEEERRLGDLRVGKASCWLGALMALMALMGRASLV